jgi:peptidyl-prolyl cis-trans isomerase A (cyclophilin A)
VLRRSLLCVLAALALAGCGGSTSSSKSPPPDLLDPAKLTEKAPQLFDVTFKTTAGTFVIGVHRTWAPRGADRFYNLVKHHFYDGAKFFRVVPRFVVQFGVSPYPEVSKAWEAANIPDDRITVQNQRGAVSFAAAGPNTRTTQVFIDLGPNLQLDVDTFAPFGSVTDGMNVVDKLYSGYGDKPTPHQPEMENQGKAYFEKSWPKLDTILSTKVANESNPALP